MKLALGYASLLSPISIRRLSPNVGRIIPVDIPGHARCFNSYGTLSIAKGLAHKDDKELAHAAAILRAGSTLYALAFELDETDFTTYQRHEFRYDLREVQVVSRKTGEALSAIICYEGADQVGVPDISALYAQYGVSAFWHTQHLPAEVYLKHCLAAARELGEDWVNNFLDTTYIHDRETSLRSYLEGRGVDVAGYVEAAELSEVF